MVDILNKEFRKKRAIINIKDTTVWSICMVSVIFDKIIELQKHYSLKELDKM